MAINEIRDGETLKSVRQKLNNVISIANEVDELDKGVEFLEIIRNGLGAKLVRDTTNLTQVVNFKKGQIIYFADVVKDDIFYIKNDVSIPADENIEDAWNNDKTNIEKIISFDVNNPTSVARWKALAKEMLQAILT